MHDPKPLPIPTYWLYPCGMPPHAYIDEREAEPDDNDAPWCKAGDVRELCKMQIAADGARGSMMIELRDRCCRAEAQRDRLVALLRSELDAEEKEARELYDGVLEPHLHLCRDRVTEALAAIDKENNA